MQNNKVHKRFRYVVLNLLIVIFLPELSVFDQTIARGRLPLGPNAIWARKTAVRRPDQDLLRWPCVA